jgi:hypothetical protein
MDDILFKKYILFNIKNQPSPSCFAIHPAPGGELNFVFCSGDTPKGE